MEGSGYTEIAGQRFDWERNDLFVAPNFLWRRHVNTGKTDAVLYSVSEAPLMEKIGQYRAQGRLQDGTVTELVA
jgi:gentisate 1,2-dioxygenase